jgi:hypothetical protein
MRLACSLAVLALVLCGCAAPAANSVVEVPSAPSSAGTSASPRPSASTAGVPSDAIDVRAYPYADFASPDGKIRCSLTSEDATCNFPDGMDRAGVPGPGKICPGAPLKVAGVTVSGIAEYFCSRGDDAHPQQKSSAAVWARSAGVATVAVGKENLVTLPDGRTIVHGKLSCASSGGAITCSQSQTKASFTISDAGVKLSSRA